MVSDYVHLKYHELRQDELNRTLSRLRPWTSSKRPGIVRTVQDFLVACMEAHRIASRARKTVWSRAMSDFHEAHRPGGPAAA